MFIVGFGILASNQSFFRQNAGYQRGVGNLRACIWANKIDARF